MKNITDKQLAEKISELKETERSVKEKLTTLENELKKRKNKTPLGVPFIPKNEEDYWLIESRGFPFFTRNKDSFDVATTKFLNAFNSKESAEKHYEMLLAWRMALVANAKGEPIDIKVLLPLMRKGWVAMDENGHWFWYEYKPFREIIFWNSIKGEFQEVLFLFNIKPAEDWRESLMECGL